MENIFKKVVGVNHFDEKSVYLLLEENGKANLFVIPREITTQIYGNRIKELRALKQLCHFKRELRYKEVTDKKLQELIDKLLKFDFNVVQKESQSSAFLLDLNDSFSYKTNYYYLEKDGIEQHVKEKSGIENLEMSKDPFEREF